MFAPVLQQFGLSKNEAIIYEVLLKYGEISVGNIAKHSEVHRRNVYDALKRLTEKGLVFEVLSARENTYKAVDPQKLKEFLREKEEVLDRALPHMQGLYNSNPHTEEVMIYRGIEGWKNYFQDILRTEKDFYCIGGKGGWLDARAANYFPQFIREAQRKKIKMWHILDPEVKIKDPGILQHIGENYRFLPKGFETTSSVDIFGDRVYFPMLEVGGVAEEFQMTVIVNQQLADSFRTWFQFMWEKA